MTCRRASLLVTLLTGCAEIGDPLPVGAGDPVDADAGERPASADADTDPHVDAGGDDGPVALSGGFLDTVAATGVEVDADGAALRFSHRACDDGPGSSSCSTRSLGSLEIAGARFSGDGFLSEAPITGVVIEDAGTTIWFLHRRCRGGNGNPSCVTTPLGELRLDGARLDGDFLSTDEVTGLAVQGGGALLRFQHQACTGGNGPNMTCATTVLGSATLSHP